MYGESYSLTELISEEIHNFKEKKELNQSAEGFSELI